MSCDLPNLPLEKRCVLHKRIAEKNIHTNTNAQTNQNGTTFLLPPLNNHLSILENTEQTTATTKKIDTAIKKRMMTIAPFFI